MKKLIAARINTGKAVHIARAFETPSGVKGYDLSCGSNNSGMRARIHGLSLEVTKENITCKKCLKAFEEQEQEQAKELDKNSQEYKIAKLREFAAREENEELESLAALKKAFENKETFVLSK
jgi:hypothetical protein